MKAIKVTKPAAGPGEVLLNLTYVEASYIRVLLRNVGGHRRDTCRAIGEAMDTELQESGVVVPLHPDSFMLKTIEASGTADEFAGCVLGALASAKGEPA
jgi:hypothetical protein